MAPVTLRLDERPWTANSARAAKHWSVNSTRTKAWREAFARLAADVGPIGPAVLVVTPYLRDRRHRQDVAACAPAAKAAIDGLVDAGVWPDDTAEWVTAVTYMPPVYGQGDGLELRIYPGRAIPGTFEVRPACQSFEVRAS